MSVDKYKEKVMLKLLALDRFTILLMVMVVLASIVPVAGQAA